MSLQDSHPTNAPYVGMIYKKKCMKNRMGCGR